MVSARVPSDFERAVPFIRVRYYWNLNQLGIFSKHTQIPTFMKIRPVVVDVFHTDRQTE